MFLSTEPLERASPAGASEIKASFEQQSLRVDPGPNKTRAQWLKEEILPHAPAVRQMIRRRYPGIDVEETLQAAYLRLMSVRDIGHIKDSKWYFHQTAHSVVRDQARRNQLAEFVPLDLHACEWAADEPSAEEVFDARRALQRLTDVVNQLPPRQRAVVELRRIDGLGVHATAQRLSVSVSSVEKYQKYAMRKLTAERARF